MGDAKEGDYELNADGDGPDDSKAGMENGLQRLGTSGTLILDLLTDHVNLTRLLPQSTDIQDLKESSIAASNAASERGEKTLQEMKKIEEAIEKGNSLARSEGVEVGEGLKKVEEAILKGNSLLKAESMGLAKKIGALETQMCNITAALVDDQVLMKGHTEALKGLTRAIQELPEKFGNPEFAGSLIRIFASVLNKATQSTVNRVSEEIEDHDPSYIKGVVDVGLSVMAIAQGVEASIEPKLDAKTGLQPERPNHKTPTETHPGSTSQSKHEHEKTHQEDRAISTVQKEELDALKEPHEPTDSQGSTKGKKRKAEVDDAEPVRKLRSRKDSTASNKPVSKRK